MSEIDHLDDCERAGSLRRIKSIRPRSGSMEEFEKHTYEAGHPVDWEEARGIFRDKGATLRSSGAWYAVLGRAWGDGRILVAAVDIGENGIGTIITARPATAGEQQNYRRKGK